MGALLRVTVLMTLAAAAVLVQAGVAEAGVSMGISLSWPNGAGVGNGNLAGSFTVQNLNTGTNQTDTLTVTVMQPGAVVRSGSFGHGRTAQPPIPVSSICRRLPPAPQAPRALGVAFTVSAPDASGAVTLTPSTAVVLQGPDAGVAADLTAAP